MSEGNLRENSPSSNAEWHTGIINGNTFRNKEVKYRMINGMAIFEGDIILARSPEQLEKLSHEPKVPGENQPTVKPIIRAIVRAGDELRWPRGEIPYVIQSILPNQQRVSDAIQHWEERTPIRFIRRDENNSRYYPNYVEFRRPVNDKGEPILGQCSSPVGMMGWGEQTIFLSDDCSTGSAIHEIGHTAGLWHEQSREDRDDFIRIIWDNIIPDMQFNFSQHIVDGDDVGPYDYCSIMHYDAWAFSIDDKTRNKPTIEVKQRGYPCGNEDRIGQTDVLSNGDIAAAAEMYGNLTPIVTQYTDGKLEVFTIGSDGKLYHKLQKSANSNEWEPSNTKQGNQEIQNWSSLGLEQQFFSSGQRPAIVRSVGGRLDVFWLKDTMHYHAYQSTPNSSWSSTSSWETGGGDFDGDPVVAQNMNGSLEVFMVHEELASNNFRLHHATRDGGPLPSLGGRWSPNARPAIAMNADGRLEVFMVDPNGELQHRWQGMMNSSNWSEEWSSLGSPFLGDPAVVSSLVDVSETRLHVFVVNGNNRELEYRWQTAGDSTSWSNWNSLEGHWSPRRRAAVVQNANGRIEVFMVGTDRRLYHRWQTGWNNTTNRPNWYMNWVPLGKEQWPLSSNPAVAHNADRRLEVFMVGNDGRFYHRWQTTPNDSSQWSGSWALL